MAVFFICAGLLGALAAILTMYVGRMRGQKKIFLGDGGDPELTGAIRAHGNLLELTPLILVLLCMLHGPLGHRLADILAIHPGRRPLSACRWHAGLGAVRPTGGRDFHHRDHGHRRCQPDRGRRPGTLTRGRG